MPTPGAPGRESSSRTDPYSYTSSQEHLRGSLTGLPVIDGLVPPAALPEGGLAGFDPHSPGNIQLDPTPSSPGEVIDLSQLTKEDTRAVVGNGQELRKAVSYDARNEVAHQYYVQLQERVRQRNTKPVEKQAAEAQLPAPQPVLSQPVVQAPQPRMSPMERMTRPPIQPNHIYQPIAQAEQQAEAPNEQVIFEIEGVGPFEAWYHEVIRDGELLVLVYDRRHKGVKWLPPRLQDDSGNERRLFVDVSSHQEAYQVRSLGLAYPFRHFDHCVLIIENAVSKQ